MFSVKRVDFSAESAANDFVSSLHDTGFAVLYNHPLQQAQVQNFV